MTLSLANEKSTTLAKMYACKFCPVKNSIKFPPDTQEQVVVNNCVIRDFYFQMITLLKETQN